MHAVTLSGPGGPEVLGWGEVPDPPAPERGEVLVGVVAAGVNRADLLQRQGHYPPPPGVSEILGMECSGTVVAVGDALEGWSVGDEVVALVSGGAYAQQVVVPAGQLLPAPPGVSLVDAAGLAETTCTVWSTVIDNARLADGETILVHGGSSGIGTTAIQLVRALRPKARVIVTAGSAAKLARCLELGADVAIPYRDEDFVERVREETGGHGADVILDNMGASYLARNVAALAPDGRLVVIGLQGGVTAELNLGALLPKRASLLALSLRGRPAAQKAHIVSGVLRDVWPEVEAGTIRPIVDRVLPMARAGEAHRVLEESGHIGKVLLEVVDDQG